MKIINGIKLYETFEEFQSDYPNAKYCDYLDYRLIGYIGL